MTNILKSNTQQFCDNCSDNIIFELHSKNNNIPVHIGIKTILECLAVAIEQGELPKLPSTWVQDSCSLHSMEFPDGTWYNDRTI